MCRILLLTHAHTRTHTHTHAHAHAHTHTLTHRNYTERNAPILQQYRSRRLSRVHTSTLHTHTHTHTHTKPFCSPAIFNPSLPLPLSLLSAQNLIEIGKQGDLRHSITNFYAKFASQAQHSAEFKPVFIVPYYDVFGLGKSVCVCCVKTCISLSPSLSLTHTPSLSPSLTHTHTPPPPLSRSPQSNWS